LVFLKAGGGQLREYPHVEALHHALIGGLSERMTVAGWQVDPTADLGMGDGVVGLFRYPLNDEFASTAWFAWLGDLPPLRVDSVVGVSYQRSFRVWPYLTNGYPHSELRIGVEDLGRAAGWVELWELDDVDRAVDELVTPVLDQAMDWAEPHGSVEALLAALSTSEEADVHLMDVPVVLAAAGRLDDARQALSDALDTPRDRADEQYAAGFAARFEAWLASGAQPAPPKEPDLPRSAD
jgi:hypothetical protein